MVRDSAIRLERPIATTVLVRFDLFLAKFASDSTRFRRRDFAEERKTYWVNPC